MTPNNQINPLISSLRKMMKRHHIDAYLIPSADFHQSEYVGEHFKTRAFLTGFDGTAGTALITSDHAYLWTDGRYFIQAEQQLEGSEIHLFRMGNPGVPTITEFLIQELPEGVTLGFDGRVISVTDGMQYDKIIADKQGTICYDIDLIDELWTERPPLSAEPAFHLSDEYTGASTATKLANLRQKMKEANATAHIITALDDLCWVFNFRGEDVKFSPLVLGYAIIYMNSVDLFIDSSKLTPEIMENLQASQVHCHSYHSIYDYVKGMNQDAILLDPMKLNYALYNNIPSSATKVEADNPSILMKAMKNTAELDNIRAAHIKDGVAVTKYMRWLKLNIGKIPMSELIASEKLEAFRSEQEGFLWPSFAPICAYKEHAAICHYNATPESNKELKPEGLFLSDTGGNYYQGSTDITRTLALGPCTDEEKLHFTTVAKSMLTLANTKFQYGVCGFNLDAIARKPFWDMGLDFNHGTGHGVGYLLSIHEGPANFNWRFRANASYPLEEGMILTDEPGLYIAGSHGIRTENELIVRKGPANEYGQFMYFETITFAPIDLDAMDFSLLSIEDKKLLNQYHKQVWTNISPYLNEEEQDWLREYTREI